MRNAFQQTCQEASAGCGAVATNGIQTPRELIVGEPKKHAPATKNFMGSHGIAIGVARCNAGIADKDLSKFARNPGKPLADCSVNVISWLYRRHAPYQTVNQSLTTCTFPERYHRYRRQDCQPPPGEHPMRICLLLIASLSVISCGAAGSGLITHSLATCRRRNSRKSGIWLSWELQDTEELRHAWATLPPCDDLIKYVRFTLLSLGAHDVHIDQRGCRGPSGLVRSIDATFWVLAPVSKSVDQASGHTIAARWQTVEIQAATNWDFSTCGSARYVTLKVLPMFSTRDVKDISTAVCDKFGVGLRAQVLVQAQPLADAR